MAPKKGAKRKSGKPLHTEETDRLSHDEAVQGANLASGVPVEHFDAVLEHQDPQELNDDVLQEALVAAHTEGVEPAVEEPAEGEEKVNTSVVKDKFKVKYAENAKAVGAVGKAAKRSNWDWLAQEIAKACLDDKAKINIGSFITLLDVNGVDYSRWTNRNKGWEGRFRMTGRVALQKIVANRGYLKKVASDSVPPADWVEKYKTKA
jgi:hypothetical protein